MAKPTVKSRAISPAKQEWLLENGIFKQPNFKETSNSISREEDDFVPLSYRVDRSLDENKKIERKSFDTLWDMCHGKCSRKTFGSETYGNYHHILDKVYNSFERKGATGAIMAIEVLCTTDAILSSLLRRYASADELSAIFTWQRKSSIHDPHPAAVSDSSRIAPWWKGEPCTCAICRDDEKYPRRSLS
jgi:hypothetical protein